MLIHPAEARRESANNIQAAVRLDSRLESQGDQIAPPLKTDSMRAHEIKIDKSDRLLNSDDNHTGLIVSALAASTIFALFAISALPWPFASTSGKRSESSQNLGSSVSPLVPKQVDRLPINGTITQTDGPSPAQLPQSSTISFSSANRQAKSSVSAAPTNSSTAKDPQTRAKLTAVPETRPTTIEGWTLREVDNGTAVLEGPNGIRKVARGDTVPGLGRVESIFRWGNHLIVATSRGLISTP
jgi:hypothetical protein